MGYDPSILQLEHIKRMLSHAERQKMGAAGITADEARAKHEATSERRMHEEFSAWLNLHRDECYYNHCRMDRKTSDRVGNPDFVIQRGGRVLNIELKTATGKLRAEQQQVHDWIIRTGGDVRVLRSSAEAIKATAGFITEGKA